MCVCIVCVLCACVLCVCALCRHGNGSAVETLFSQLKHTTASNLSAANYETAKATLLTKVQSKGKDDYRSDTLYLRQSDLMRKPGTKK